MRQHKTLLAALWVIAATLPMTAQPSPDHGKQHIRYVLVDLGTFGGPTSSLNCCGNVPPVLNNRGTVTGSADTSKPNPNFTNFNPCIPPGSLPQLVIQMAEWQPHQLKTPPGRLQHHQRVHQCSWRD